MLPVSYSDDLQTVELNVPVTLASIQAQLSPLDLVGFSGSDLVSRAIKIVEQISSDDKKEALFSHIGIIVNSDLLPDVANLIPNKLYVWESTMSLRPYSNVGDVESKTGRYGVQIRDLEEVIDSYGGKVAICPLLNNPWRQDYVPNAQAAGGIVGTLEQRRVIIRQRIKLLHRKYGTMLYDSNVCNICAAAFRCFRPLKQSLDVLYVHQRKILTNIGVIRPGEATNLNPTDWMFCSELVAEAWKVVSVLPSTVIADHYIPIDPLGSRDLPAVVILPVVFVVKSDSQSKSLGMFRNVIQ